VSFVGPIRDLFSQLKKKKKNIQNFIKLANRLNFANLTCQLVEIG
jgi:hypothetical protein